MAAEHQHGVSRALGIGLALTLAFAVVEVAAGAWSGSLALVSDAGHMVVDSAGLLLALAAAAVARRPADMRRSFGYARAEVLVVPIHVMLMLGITGYIAWEAFQRAGSDLDISAGPVLIVGVAGLGMNVLVFRLLHGHSATNLNARGAMFEVAADALGSVGVIVSAVVIITTGWKAIDIVVSLLIAALVVPRAWLLFRQAVLILLEGAPPEMELAQIERDAMTIPGVLSLHDLHVWSLAPSFVSLERARRGGVDGRQRAGDRDAQRYAPRTTRDQPCHAAAGDQRAARSGGVLRLPRRRGARPHARAAHHNRSGTVNLP